VPLLFRKHTKNKEQKKNKQAVALALRWRWRTITRRGSPHKGGLGPMPGGAAPALAVPRRAKEILYRNELALGRPEC